jgi:hypothetical protein
MSKPHTPHSHTPWDELTTARQRLAKTIAHVHGHETFERPSLKDDVKASTDLEVFIDSKDRVLTSLKSTSMLNDLDDDGYLENEYQGGENPIILDLEYDESRDDRETAPFGYDSAFNAIVSQILEREGLTREALGNVDWDDYNDIIDAVNAAVGRVVLVIVSEPSRYRFTEGAFSKVEKELEEDEDD